MKLSILIPMYNAKNYIGNCIESVMNQDISEDDYEIIIIDDGSNDTSVALVEAYAQKYKNIHLYQEPNSGAYTTRNKLLKLAKGDYIFNLDADDYIVYNCLSTLLKIAENNQLDIIGFKTKETSDLNYFELSESIGDNTTILSSGIEFIENNNYLRYEIWWYFIKRDFMIEHGMDFNNNEYNADVIFTSNALLKAERVGYVPLSIHRYVQTQDSLMRSKNFEITKKRIEYIQMMIGNKSQLINNLKDKNHSNTLIENMSHRRDIFTFFNIMNMLRNPFSKAYIKNRINAFKAVDAYPLKNFTKYKYKSRRYKILTLIFNSENLLYTIVSVKNLFSKPINN